MSIVDQPEVIPLWPGDPPGSEDWNQQEQEIFAPPPISFRSVRNVTQPTLTAFLPHPSTASGTAAIICPGGGFHALAIDHEGIDVAARFGVEPWSEPDRHYGLLGRRQSHRGCGT